MGLNCKLVIDYVIEASLKSKNCDKILIVADEEYIEYSRYLKSRKFDMAPNGNERYDSINNGFEYIKNNYDCDKIIIVDAVAPFLYP